MYIRLTSRCNMTCAHCAFSCTSRGQDITRDTFKAALDIASGFCSNVTLGGGEPTVHPQFWELFGLALGYFHHDDGGLYIVTNGKIRDSALALAKLAKAGLIGASLSQDRYHDSIEPEVVEAFTKDKPEFGFYSRSRHDMRCISSVHTVINAGRAKKNGIGMEDRCFCDDLMVDPNGTLWQCGHRKKSFGTVFAPRIPASYFDGDDNLCSERGAAA